MSIPSPLIVAVVVVTVVIFVGRLLVLAYRNRNGDLGGRTVDGDHVFSDDRLNEMLYARAPSEETEEDDLDLDASETITCTECRTPNEVTYTYCRNCAAKLSGS